MNAQVTGSRLQPRSLAESSAGTSLNEVLAGFLQSPKRLPCKLLYDAHGAELFERICELEEYYPTRTEAAILRDNIDSIAAALEGTRVLVEYGSGTSTKTRMLLNAVSTLAIYVPIDVCQPVLERSAATLRRAYPKLEIFPICADYTRSHEIPPHTQAFRRTAFFPGSTIGNLDRSEVASFFGRVRRACGSHGSLLVGVDLKKSPAHLLRAYDDKHGITAKFNLNILRVLNRDFDANFHLDRFQHRAVWNEQESRIEMHLVSRCRQVVSIGTRPVRFDPGESIVTEHCHKYDLDSFRRLAEASAMRVRNVWVDSRELFSVQLLAVSG